MRRPLFVGLLLLRDGSAGLGEAVRALLAVERGRDAEAAAEGAVHGLHIVVARLQSYLGEVLVRGAEQTRAEAHLDIAQPRVKVHPQSLVDILAQVVAVHPEAVGYFVEGRIACQQRRVALAVHHARDGLLDDPVAARHVALVPDPFEPLDVKVYALGRQRRDEEIDEDARERNGRMYENR